MKKRIIYRIALLAFTGIALAATLLVQGCAQNGEGRDSITGPAPDPVQQEQTFGDALSAQPVYPMESEARPIRPLPACEINHTAEVLFINYSRSITYDVIVNGKERGFLVPQSKMLVTVPEGGVKWQLLKKGGKGEPAFGSLFAKRCGHYQVKVALDPRQREMENFEE